MPELLRLGGLLAKEESTYKTDPTPTIADDGIQVEESLHDNMEWGYLEENLREGLAGVALGRYGEEIPVGRYMNIEVTTALKGPGIAYVDATVAPESDVLLRSCGLAATYDEGVGTESVTYALVSSAFESCTIWAYSGSKLYKVNGCRGNARILFTPGQVPRGVFAMRGFLASITQLALPTIVYPYKAIIPPTVKNAGLSLNSVDPAGFDDFELDLGVRIVDLPNGNDADGMAGVYVSDYDPRVKTMIERAAISAFDPWALRAAGTRFAWDCGPIGATQYNKVTVSGPKGRIVNDSGGDSDGIAMTELEIQAQHTDAESEDAVSIVFS